jgi:DNA-binding CsgD family transcriptional regulator
MDSVVEGAVGTVAGVVGRERELDVLRGFFGADGSSRALVLTGVAGIGKTTLWEAGVEVAREHGHRVLLARPSEAEARLSFAALIDLFEAVDVGVLAGVPVSQRSALEVALLRAAPMRVPRQPHAIALGVLNGLRALAVEQPVVIAVDDFPWLDAPSADALVFAARRLEDARVQFLLARRPGRPSALESAFEARSLEGLELGPLGFSASRRLLSDRLGLLLSRQVMRRMVAATLGNPLFVLEVGRALLERGPPVVGEEVPVPDRLEDLLGTRVGRLPPAARRALLALALNGDLRVEELTAVVGAPAVDAAVDTGVLLVDTGRVRVAHPLLAAVARKRSRPLERRELHRDLAAALADSELRARHLALAAEGPDPALAAMLDAAAISATGRGAAHDAVTLREHALRLTPADLPARTERLLALADCLNVAGESQRLTDLLLREIGSIPAGRERVRAYVLLADGAASFDEFDAHLVRAFGEAGADPLLRAPILALRADAVALARVERIAETEAWALEALAARAIEPAVAQLALNSLGWARALRGRQIDELGTRDHAIAERPGELARSLDRVEAVRLIWRGEHVAARERLGRLEQLADDRGERYSYAVVQLHQCELELRAGGWQAVSRTLDEWDESADRDELRGAAHERCRALLAAGRGVAADAARWAEEAIASAERLGVRWDWLEAMRARGVVALLEQDPARAAASLRPVWEHTCREGVDDPGAFPVAPELVEALADLGEREEAMAVIVRLRALSEQQQHPWGLVTAHRCEAVVRLAGGAYDEPAALALAGAAADYARLGLRFDRARSLLSVGRAQRRLKKWGPARESLRSAIAAFEELGSCGWAQRARSELERIGARRARPSGELTPTEREVVKLAASGRANKEIAQALSLAVHTVEVHLSRAYGKLGVRSRSQLAGRLTDRR